MKVKRLPNDPGPAGWNALLPRAPAPQVLEDAITADWLIIGAGFAGLAAARRLSQTQTGDRIVVLEACRVGEGPAGRNSGFMIDLPHDLSSDDYSGDRERDRAQIVANRAAIDFAGSAAREYGLPEEALSRMGKINGAATARGEAHIADYGTHLQALDEPHEILDARAMRDVTGSSYYRAGLFSPGTVMIQPAMFVRGLAAGLSSNRVLIFEGSPVVALTRDGQNWAASTPAGQVTAPKVILAVNGHIESFGHFRRRLVHVLTYASMTEALGPDQVRALGGRTRWGLTSADPLGTTVRRISGTGGDRIVVRNRVTYDPSLEITDAALRRATRRHDADFAARFPTLAGTRMQYRWGGRLCLSLNDAPAFGEVDENLFSACCQNGLGTTRGTFSGIAAADLCRDAETNFTNQDKMSEEPARLPPGPVAMIGANVKIAWGEWAAGKEL